jgi:signal transduction histidine kinase/ligand-binding sensor domain-containing protein
MGMRRAGAFRVCALLALAAAPVLALSPSLEIRRYLHTSWADRDGNPLGPINAIAQPRDGYLWMATGRGILRFDGVRFSAPPLRPGQSLPEGPVFRLLAAHDGSVWFSSEAGLSRWQDGAVRTYPTSQAGRANRRVLEDAAGRIWILTNEPALNAVASLAPGDNAVRRYSTSDGLPAEEIRTIAVAGPGSLWVAAGSGICRWTPGSPANCQPLPGAAWALFPDSGGGVFAATGKAIVHLSQGKLETLFAPAPDITIYPDALLVDRDGNVWVGTSAGLLRIHAGKVERFTRRDGLSGDVVQSLFEDSERDLWVGSAVAIERFRDPRVLHFSTLDGLSGDFVTAVQPGPDGDMWVGTMGNGLNRVQAGRVTVYSSRNGLPGKSITTMYLDRARGLWAGTEEGLARLRNGRFSTVSRADGGPLDSVFSLAEDSSGALWAPRGKEVWRVRGDRVEAVPGLPFNDIFRVTVARDGSLLLGSFTGGVVRFSNGPQTVYGPSSGIGPGPPRAIYEDPEGVLWIGASATLTRVREGKLTTWGPRQGMPAGEIYGIAGERRGDLWLLTSTAVLRLALADLGRIADGAPETLHPSRYDSRDGLRLTDHGGMGGPRIAIAQDGRIWISAQDGVEILDPDLLQPNPIPPPVSVEQFTVDGRPIDRFALAFRGRETRIAYTGLSLMAPERVHFRYRLEPIEAGWTDADTREVAFVSLPPGDYRFRVAAANLDGLWNEAGASVDFRVQPYFHQTVWFKLLLAAIAAHLAWLFYTLRMRRLLGRFQLVSQERARVTREIHDSLLQGFAGVVYQLEAASRQFESDPVLSKQKLDRALDGADQSLREARQMLLDMRLPVLDDRTLPEALAEVGEHAVEDLPTSFQLKTKGLVVPLPYAAQAAMFLIGREAILNAVNHAGALRIAVHLHYADKQVRLTVEDDGSGFDPAAGSAKEGHFGLRSMGERAKQVAADFRVDTAPGKGTTVVVTLARKPPRPTS